MKFYPGVHPFSTEQFRFNEDEWLKEVYFSVCNPDVSVSNVCRQMFEELRACSSEAIEMKFCVSQLSVASGTRWEQQQILEKMQRILLKRYGQIHAKEPLTHFGDDARDFLKQQGGWKDAKSITIWKNCLLGITNPEVLSKIYPLYVEQYYSEASFEELKPFFQHSLSRILEGAFHFFGQDEPQLNLHLEALQSSTLLWKFPDLLGQTYALNDLSEMIRGTHQNFSKLASQHENSSFGQTYEVHFFQTLETFCTNLFNQPAFHSYLSWEQRIGIQAKTKNFLAQRNWGNGQFIPSRSGETPSRIRTKRQKLE